MAFWTSWALWEQLVFVLSMAIIVTVLAGCIRLVHKHHQLRKFTRIDQEKKAQQQKQMEQTQRVRRGRAADIPFGIRAIESGVEVEGVWISRSNTPTSSGPPSGPPSAAPSIPGSPASSAGDKTSPKGIPPLAMPRPVHSYPRAAGHRSRSNSRSPVRSPDALFERAVSAERLPSRNESTTPPDTALRGRPTYKPRQSSHLRFSSGDILTTAQDDEKALPASDVSSSDNIHPALRNTHGSSASFDTPEHYTPRRADPSLSAYPQAYTALRQSAIDLLPFTCDSRTESDLSSSRRRPQPTETRQLLPHSRQISESSGEWPSAASHKAFPSEEFAQFVFTTSPTSMSNPFETPVRIPTYQPGRKEMPSFQSFPDSDPAYVPRESAPLLDNVELSDVRVKKQPLHRVDNNRPGKQPDVIRKVNSGFEILRPGSFAIPTKGLPITETRPEAHTGNRRQSRKLHKKNPSGSRLSRSSGNSTGDMVQKGSRPNSHKDGPR